MSTKPLNQFYHYRNLADDTVKTVVSPNNDTLYSYTFIDLSKGPVVLSIPKIDNGRYFTFQFIDAYTNSFHYIGTRTGDTRGGKYVIVGPNWKGHIAKGTKLVKAPTNLILMGGRTLVNGTSDLDKVHAIQDKYTLTPYSKKQAAPSFDAPVIQPTDFGDPVKFFDIMTKLMKMETPPKGEKALLDQFKLIGIDPQNGFGGIQDPAVLDGLTRAVKDAREIIEKSSSSVSVNNNGWIVYNSEIGNFGDNYLLRAVIAQFALYANIPDEAMYPRATTDSNGNPLNGANKYVIHMTKEEIPQVKGFWSISMYGADQFLVKNPINRFTMGDRTEGLQYNADGSLDIYIQNEAPLGHESNWLPAPKGDFNLMLRMYIPSKETIEGKTKLPSVTKVSD
ncbi:DUF1254 domain-containing protein [Neobacillus pocheonensis]|uniref:DUF1254 domain-containing protein n=1 Tax=Neobacillus pocheonensis TaxID=363869 RepID=A0ABT0WHW3_9BACI|nr:DUF1254 domain-containing protein [Neobacillus pocheonensis]